MTPEQTTRLLNIEADKALALENIAKLLQSIAQDLGEIKNGYRYICERWPVLR